MTRRLSVRRAAGAIVHDLPRFLWAMRPSWPSRGAARPWVLMRNRRERLVRDDRGRGARCAWEWTSDLHAAAVFPSLGRRLMRRSLRDWPIELRDSPAAPADAPEISFVIGHRGIDRLPHLLCTLRSIAAQRDAAFECLVVEQSVLREVERVLPSWVRYVHAPPPAPEMPYSRAWAFNLGARRARGRLLILHDNDILVPRDYAREALDRNAEGYDFINLKRFVYYLGKDGSAAIRSSGRLLLDEPPETVVQNLEAGGSVAAGRDAYAAIGGFDESFVGWGGEDNEFWERAQTRSVWHYGYLPLVHLWHEAQPRKQEPGNPTAALFRERSAIPPAARVRELAARAQGGDRPFGPRGA